MTHPTKDWEFDDKIEEAFQEWFNDLCGGFSFRSEWFYDDAEVDDVKTRQDLMCVSGFTRHLLWVIIWVDMKDLK